MDTVPAIHYEFGFFVLKTCSLLQNLESGLPCVIAVLQFRPLYFCGAAFSHSVSLHQQTARSCRQRLFLTFSCPQASLGPDFLSLVGVLSPP